MYIYQKYIVYLINNHHDNINGDTYYMFATKKIKFFLLITKQSVSSW